jgi:hypothetical protein
MDTSLIPHLFPTQRCTQDDLVQKSSGERERARERERERELGKRAGMREGMRMREMRERGEGQKRRE